MAASHWDAFMKVASIFPKDIPSVLYHAALSGLNTSMDDWVARTFPNNNLAVYAVDGIVYTLRQDYAFALIGEGDAVPDGAGTLGIARSVAY